MIVHSDFLSQKLAGFFLNPKYPEPLNPKSSWTPNMNGNSFSCYTSGKLLSYLCSRHFWWWFLLGTFLAFLYEGFYLGVHFWEIKNPFIRPSVFGSPMWQPFIAWNICNISPSSDIGITWIVFNSFFYTAGALYNILLNKKKTSFSTASKELH